MVQIIETTYSTDLKIDQSAGVIHGVKFLGRKSKNYGEYTEQALQQAAKLFEGCHIYLDHPDRSRPQAERKVRELFGIAENIHARADGVYGDLAYLKTHVMSGPITEMALRFPNKIGMSQNAEGSRSRRGNQRFVESIYRVRSLDIVTHPSTTNGLFESEETTMKKTVMQILQTLPKQHAYYQLFENLDVEVQNKALAEEPVDVDAEMSDEMQANQAIKALLMAILDDEELLSDKKLEKLRELLTADEMKDEDETEMAESIRKLEAERDSLVAEKQVRHLLESGNREATDVRIRALLALDCKQDRQALVESWPSESLVKRRPARSVPLYGGQREQYEHADGKSFADAVRS